MITTKIIRSELPKVEFAKGILVQYKHNPEIIVLVTKVNTDDIFTGVIVTNPSSNFIGTEVTCYKSRYDFLPKGTIITLEV